MNNSEYEEQQCKEVYAYAGLALYCVQCFEMSLVNFLIIASRISGNTTTLKEIESLEEKAQKKTLGALLKDVRTIAAFDVSAVITQALVKRNFLVHHLFKKRAIEFLSEKGRDKMLVELKDSCRCFQIADTAIIALCRASGKMIGITDELLNTEFNKLNEIAAKNQ